MRSGLIAALCASLLRDARVFCRYGLFRQHQPYVASFKLTHACNLACEQCPFIHLPHQNLDYKRVIETLDRLYARGDRIVIFEGGEPTLWRDGKYCLSDVICEARQRFDRVGVTTNGTLPLTIRPDLLWVSIDGFRETYAHLRGADAINQVIENIRRADHPRIYAHITANRLNATETPDLARFLNGIVRGITIQFYYPYSRNDELYLPLNERAHLIDRLIELKRDGIRILNSFDALRALKKNTWHCESWLFDNVNANGSVFQGCYLDGRARVDCSKCGFSPYTEASFAYQGHWRAIQAGLHIFFPSRRVREEMFEKALPIE